MSNPTQAQLIALLAGSVMRTTPGMPAYGPADWAAFEADIRGRLIDCISDFLGENAVDPYDLAAE